MIMCKRCKQFLCSYAACIAGGPFQLPSTPTTNPYLFFLCLTSSYRHYPVNLDVISWLGVWYVKSELYEKAIHYFQTASQIQPTEVRRCT